MIRSFLLIAAILQLSTVASAGLIMDMSAMGRDDSRSISVADVIAARSLPIDDEETLRDAGECSGIGGDAVLTTGYSPTASGLRTSEVVLAPALLRAALAIANDSLPISPLLDGLLKPS